MDSEPAPLKELFTPVPEGVRWPDRTVAADGADEVPGEPGDSNRGDQESEVVRHGSKYATHKYPPKVAELTQYANLLPY